MPALPDPRLDPRAFLRALYDAAVRRALPGQVLGAHLPPPPRGRTVVVGAGKAGGAMAAALDAAWPADAPLSGLVVTRYEHLPPAYRARGGRIEVVEAAHPVPDAAGRAAAARIATLVQGLGPDDLVLALISGGGSALLSLPAPGLTLEDKQAVNRALLLSGASIGEMNCVRKHLSAIKGGRLAALAAPARVHSLLISDVPGDEPGVIASGPTVADATSCADALAICRRYTIELPPAARAGLEGGAFETPKPDDPCFAGHTVELIATPQQSLEAAAARAREAGIEAHVLSDEIEGESREVGKVHAALARAVARRGQPFAKPCVLLSGGETTVTVRTPGGRGGRAGEFLLGCALALQGEPGVHVLAADTDGIDGVERNAGAIVTPDTLARAAAAGLKPAEQLDRHDSFPLFEALGDLVVTGPTYTNVNDFRALLIV
ncbi:glycerate kinase type-2 family protein [Rubrivivax gelatinosus]|uniref:Hydroxypyruvate reductase n=1 Tax=Rubrivivax gelatinosus TaxID=28068 RepID=A0A4R2M6E9_RUBGE|nr:glycerate kinase [Rubrivivax gelatinosus]MBK1687514.1 glycerate kinase [Rubrivivax gelatinosus]TCP00435.1 hydroxypyruvate reductase [Rubrivivax gelatinosus]